MLGREFKGACATFGLSVPTDSATVAALSTRSSAAPADQAKAKAGWVENLSGRTVTFHDGTIVSALGQGLGILHKEDIRRGLSKKGCAQAFRSG